MKPTRTSRVPYTYKEYEHDRQFATTLARGVEILHCFSSQRPLLANKDLAELMQLPKATISRLVYTLCCMGYLVQDPDSGKYRLGSAVLSVGFPLLERFSIRMRARDGMLNLARRLGGTVSIGIRDRYDMVLIEVTRLAPRNVHPVDVGCTYPIVETAMGRAYLAGCSAYEREALLNQISVKLPEQYALHEARLKRNLDDYRKIKCCISVGEAEPEVQAVAVPIGRLEHGELAALNVSFQGRELDEKWLIEEIAPELIRFSRSLM